MLSFQVLFHIRILLLQQVLFRLSNIFLLVALSTSFLLSLFFNTLSWISYDCPILNSYLFVTVSLTKKNQCLNYFADISSTSPFSQSNIYVLRWSLKSYCLPCSCFLYFWIDFCFSRGSFLSLLGMIFFLIEALFLEMCIWYFVEIYTWALQVSIGQSQGALATCLWV